MGIRATILRGVLRAVAGQETAERLFQMLNPASSPPPRRGTAALLKGYQDLPWLHAVPGRIAHAVSDVSWKLHVQRAGKGKRAVRNVALQRAAFEGRAKKYGALKAQGDLEEILDHPVLDFLSRGNPYLSGKWAVFVTCLWLDIAGEGGWLIGRDGLNAPSHYYPIPPTWITAIAQPGRPYYTVEVNGGRWDVPETELIFFRRPAPLDPYGRGVGSAQAVTDELETDEYAAAHMKQHFFNRGRPDTLVIGTFAKEDRQRLEAQWNQRLGGLVRQWRAQFLTGDPDKIKIHEFQRGLETTGAIALRDWDFDAMLRIFASPPEIWGKLDNSNRATIEAADLFFSKYVVRPRMDEMRAVLQERLVPEFDARAILDFEDPVPEDREQRLKAMEAAPHVPQVDEWRAFMGLKPLGGAEGAAHLVPYTLQPRASLAPTLPTSGATPTEAAPADPPKAFGNGHAHSLEEGGAPGAKAHNGGRWIGTEDGGHARKGLGEEDLRALMDAVRGEVLAEAAAPVLSQTVKAFGDQVFHDGGLAAVFDLADPNVVSFLERSSSDRIVGLINETTRASLRDTLAAGAQAGEDVATLATRVEAVFDEAEGVRSFTIARTETVRAAGFGSDEGIRQAGAPRKEWLATLDDATRDSHIALNGQIVEAAGYFHVNGHSGRYPGDFGVAEEDINCRCSTLAVFDQKGETGGETRDLGALWAMKEASRVPFENQLAEAVQGAFRTQRGACLAELRRRA